MAADVIFCFFKVKKWELPIAEIRARYPQVEGFHFISSLSGQVRFLKYGTASTCHIL